MCPEFRGRRRRPGDESGARARARGGYDRIHAPRATRRPRARVTIARAAALSLLGLSCADDIDPRDIQVRCELASDAVVIEGYGAETYEVGAVGEHVLVSWEQWGPTDGGVWTSRWIDRATLAPVGERIDMGGQSRWGRPQWIAIDGRLEGYVSADPARRTSAEAGSHEILHWWSLTPGLDPVVTPLSFDVPADITEGAILGSDVTNGGPMSAYPTVLHDGRVWGGLGVVPSSCPAFSNFARLHVFGAHQPSGVPVRLDNDACELPPPATSLETQVMALPWLVPLEDSVGVLYRGWGPVPPPVHYFRFTPDGQIIGDPVRVGRTGAQNTGMNGGQQVRAVRLDDTILFSEGAPPRADFCTLIRLMNLDGSEARDAPFQLPCVSDPRVVNFPVELGQSGDYAVMVYVERSRNPFGTIEALHVTADVDWWESVKIALLTREGRLASEPLVVTDPDSTALDPIPRTADFGPFTVSFRVSAAVAPEGPSASGSVATDHVVAWSDRRPRASGITARRVRCEPIGSPE